MIYLVLFLIVCLVLCLWHIRVLRHRLESHEANWNQIEQLTDQNKEGEIVIRLEPIPDNKENE